MIIKDFKCFNEELSGKYKEETVIIYKDKDIVCLLPKSQMTSQIYGKGTNWCQVQKPGFEMWSGKNRPEKKALLIRFLMKGGRKIRFTYFPDKQYYWASENGWHVLEGEGNPFDATSPKSRTRDVEKDILELINDKIPQECKNKVLEFIDKNLKEFKYIYRDKAYIPKHLEKLKSEYDKIDYKYYDKVKEINKIGKVYINSYFKDNEIILEYTPKNSNPSNFLENTEIFTDIETFEKRLKDIIYENK